MFQIYIIIEIKYLQFHNLFLLLCRLAKLPSRDSVLSVTLFYFLECDIY